MMTYELWLQDIERQQRRIRLHLALVMLSAGLGLTGLIALVLHCLQALAR
jgi:hypothetical protein